MSTTHEHEADFTGFIKTPNGKYISYDPENRCLELSDAGKTFFSVGADGILQLGGLQANLIFRFTSPNVELCALGEYLPNSFAFVLAVEARERVTLSATDGRALLATDEKSGRLTMAPAQQANDSSRFVFVRQPLPNIHSVHDACCTISHPRAGSLRWNAPGHHALVESAARAVTRRDDAQPLRDLWRDTEFQDSLFKALTDADDLSPYNDGGFFEGQWRSHFYDPDTGKNYRGESNRTALTEGLKYFQASIIAPSAPTMGYNLGLALHYFTDLTQPCHAANFAEVYGQHYPLPSFTCVHSTFESVGDEVVAANPPTLHERIDIEPGSASPAALYQETARRAKAIFGTMDEAIPGLAQRLTYLDYVLGSGIAAYKYAALRELLLPFVTTSLKIGLDQTARLLLVWSKALEEFRAFWERLPAGLSSISAASDGAVWGIGSNGTIYRYAGKPEWEIVPGKLSMISAGSASNVWGLDSQGGIHRYVGKPEWQRLTGALSNISVASDGSVWGVNSHGHIYRYVGKPDWELIPGGASVVSVGSASNVWALNEFGHIYRYVGKPQWERVAGGLSSISVAADGMVYGVNSNGNVYRYTGKPEWEPIPGSLSTISVGSASNVWGLLAGGGANVVRHKG